MPRKLRTCAFVSVFAMAGALCFAQDFSADIVSLSGNDHIAMSKVFVSGNKAHVDMRGNEMGVSAVLVDNDQHKYYLLMPPQHAYMEMPRGTTRTFALWRPTNVNDACPEWQNLMAQIHPQEKSGTCRKVGSDTVNGRSAIKYEGTSADGQKGQAWVDTKLRCLIKYADSEGGAELRNIQEGSQPSSLFQIPAGYQKMDMGSMMGRGMAPPQ